MPKKKLTATEYKIVMVNTMRKQFPNLYTHVGTKNRLVIEQLGDHCEKYQVKMKDAAIMLKLMQAEYKKATS